MRWSEGFHGVSECGGLLALIGLMCVCVCVCVRACVCAPAHAMDAHGSGADVPQWGECGPW